MTEHQMVLIAIANSLSTLGIYFVYLRFVPPKEAPSIAHQLGLGISFFIAILLNKYLAIVLGQTAYARSEIILASAILGGYVCGLSTYALTLALRFFVETPVQSSFVPGFIDITLFFVLGILCHRLCQKRLMSLPWYQVGVVMPCLYVLAGLCSVWLIFKLGFINQKIYEVFTDLRSNPVQLARSSFFFLMVYAGMQWEFRRLNVERREREENHTLKQEVERRTQAEQVLRDLTRRDALTGLYNRRALSSYLKEASQNASFALIFLDLDDFKDINDHYGHSLGDQMLESIGQELRQMSESTDGFTAFRFGGDEFIVCVLLHTQSIEREIDAHMMRLTGQLSSALLRVYDKPLGFSAGVACYPKDTLDAENLIRQADLAMYHTKTTSKGSWQFYDQKIQESSHRRYLLSKGLSRAIEQEQLYLVYQPLYDRQGQRLLGFEALARWHHDQLGDVSPAEFVPLLEMSADIQLLSLWSLQQAQSFHVECRRSNSQISVAWNFSPALFSFPDALDKILRVFTPSGDDASGHCIVEITEGCTAEQPELAKTFIQKLRERGCRVYIDDFGAGFSSLSELSNPLFDGIKIDRSLVKREGHDKEQSEVLYSLIDLAKRLGKAVVVEGVEEQAQLERLQRTACDKIQGFYCGRPMKIDEARALVKRQRALAGSEPSTPAQQARTQPTTLNDPPDFVS